jgi:shikimate kinase
VTLPKNTSMKGTPGLRQEVEAPVAKCEAPVRTVFLVGFMGAGKTSVGRALSQHLGWRFVDLDDRIRAREGRTITDIFRQGEAQFRRSEVAALRELLTEAESGPPLITALGGGAFAQQEIASLLKDAGSITVFLDAPADELWRRCGADEVDRPLRRTEEEFRQLYARRRPQYLQASVRVETAGREIERIVREIAGSLRLDNASSDEEK